MLKKSDQKEKTNRFTLIELPVVTSHFCWDWLPGLKKSKGKRMFSSPAREAGEAGEAVQLHLN